MSTVIKLLAVLAGLSVGYAIPALFFVSQTAFGVGVAVAAGCWLVIEGIKFGRRWSGDRLRAGRDEVWQARVRERGWR